MLVETVLRAKGNTVVTTGSEATVGEAARVLAANRIGALVVVDRGEIVGVFSERDIVRGMADQGERLFHMPIAELMTRNVVTCAPGDSLESLMATMTNRRLRHLPVIDGGRLVGIVTIGDVVKNRLEEATMVADSLKRYVTDSR